MFSSGSVFFSFFFPLMWQVVHGGICHRRTADKPFPVSLEDIEKPQEVILLLGQG